MSKRGSLVSLKQEPKLCQIQPSLDLKTWSLTLAAEGEAGVQHGMVEPLNAEEASSLRSHNFRSERVCVYVTMGQAGVS